MIRVSRQELPADLIQRMEQLGSQIVDVHNARELWRSANVRKRLRNVLGEMAPGRESCMYCGDGQGTDVDHHEPIVVNPLRTFDWLNHILACSVCNSQHKRDRYPVDAQGRPLLIDPTTEDPFEHLFLPPTLSEYLPLTPKGKATIDVCGLNRPLLVRGRANARTIFRMCLNELAEAHHRGDSDRTALIVATVHDQPFADVCQSMLRQAVAPGADVVFGDDPDTLTLLRNPSLRKVLLSGESDV